MSLLSLPTPTLTTHPPSQSPSPTLLLCEQSTLSSQTRINSLLTNSPTRAFFATAGTVFVFSLYNLQIRGITVSNAGVGMACFFGGLCQFVAGMWGMSIRTLSLLKDTIWADRMIHQRLLPAIHSPQVVSALCLPFDVVMGYYNEGPNFISGPTWNFPDHRQIVPPSIMLDP